MWSRLRCRFGVWALGAPLGLLGLLGIAPGGMAAAQSFFTGAPKVETPNPQATELLGKIGFDQKLGASVPLDLPFRDETGAAVTLRGLANGKPLLLVPAYYRCPMLCTLVLNGVAASLRAVSLEPGRDYEVAVVSFDPEETPELARATHERLFARIERLGTGGVHLLTGPESSIRPVMDAIGFRYAWDAPRQQWAHSAGIVVLTPQGLTARYFYGVEYAPRDVRLGLVEAANGAIGSAVDHVLLYCLKYDPTTGKYTAVVLNMLRLAAALTVALIALYFLVSWRRPKLRTSVGKA